MKQIIFSLLLSFPIILFGQNFEIGANIGGTNYNGDLAPTFFVPKESHFAGGVFLRYNANEFISVRAQIFFGMISGNDMNFDTENARSRNLSFESPITEFSIMPEWNILGFDSYNQEKPFSPFLTAGIAFYKFNPRTSYENRFVDLQPLGTEGQGMSGFPQRYQLTQFAIPIGGGVKVAPTHNITITAEASLRKVFTDYLDDVSTNYVSYDDLLDGNGEISAELGSRTWEFFGVRPDEISKVTGDQRGNAGIDDWYYSASITFSFIFSDGSGGGKMGCPVW